MKDLNNFSCTCFCCKEPELKKTSDNTLCITRVGVNRIKDGEVDWFSVKLWGKKAEIFSQYVKKGSQLALNGRVQIESNEDKLFPTIYVEDFRFIGGGNGQKKEQKEEGGGEESVAVVNDVAVEGGISDEDIPF